MASDEEAITRRCYKCGEPKPLGEFNRCRRDPLGRQRKCRACEKAYRDGPGKEKRRRSKRAYYLKNRPKMLARSRAQRLANLEKYAEYSRLDRQRHPQRHAARTAVSKAVRDGKLIRKPCERCGLEPKRINGNNRMEGHHWRGYKPEFHLDVRWLCRRCHKIEDAEQEAKDAASECR